MEIISPESQFQVFLDEVRLPADALVGSEDAAIAQLFAGLNPERIIGAAMAVGTGRLAIRTATEYVKTRQVWKVPIGSHQGISHPLAQIHIELELAKLMMQKAATLYDAGDDFGAAEAANMAKYAAGEASVRAVDQAVQSLGGSGLTRSTASLRRSRPRGWHASLRSAVRWCLTSWRRPRWVCRAHADRKVS